jgi:hypothetical protein
MVAAGFLQSKADTFSFLASLNHNDEAHARAVEYVPLIESLRATEWVLTELADNLASSHQRVIFVQTREELQAPSLQA